MTCVKQNIVIVLFTKGSLFVCLFVYLYFPKVLYTDFPLVASAPTGSGKTAIFELAIVRLLMQIGEGVASTKIVYGRYGHLQLATCTI